MTHVHEDRSHYYETSHDPNSKGVMFRIDVRDAGEYLLQLHKTPRNSLPVRQQMGY